MHPEKQEFHRGLDFKAKAGTDIPAAATGTVVYSGRNEGLGNTVIVKDSEGYFHLYAHMQDGGRMPRRGDSVKQGDIVGQVGSTGLRTTGPHLHYSVLDKMSGVRKADGGSLGVKLSDAAINPSTYDRGEGAASGVIGVEAGQPDVGNAKAISSVWKAPNASSIASIVPPPQSGPFPGITQSSAGQDGSYPRDLQATRGPAVPPGVPFISGNNPMSPGQSSSFDDRWSAINDLPGMFPDYLRPYLGQNGGAAEGPQAGPPATAPAIPFVSANDPTSQGRLSFYDRWSGMNDLPGAIPDYLRPYFPQGGSGAGNAQSQGLDIGPPEVLAPLTRPPSQTGSYDDLLRSLFAPDDLSRRVPDNLRRSDADDGAEPESSASVVIRRLTSRIVQY